MSTITINAVNHLRILLSEEKFLFLGNPADEKLLQLFLHFTDYDIDKALEKVISYYKLKEKYSDFYAFKRDPKLHDVILKKGINTMLEDRDPLGRRILVYKLVDDLWLTLACDEEETQRNGLVIVFDLKNFPWKFLRSFTPYNIRATTAKAESLPIENIQYHVINYGWVVGLLVSLVFPFLKEETKNKIYFHNSMESLHSQVSPSALPREYGGDRPSPVQAKRVKEYLDPQNTRLSDLLSYGYMKKPEDF
ncbi:alpha-tocopherol transfer protein-like isoform X2 [Macrosteles quadrilineatus]|uniref:alpha-tocopherol transfer protein-like isoform X2 n=1 Tax=Macrosteles quadrilineatus TaxID=74068 RepID=UPI0023E0A75D|nr:alpha-tocopherol transfer protein-like isoform X2 [Macrosteles quadrilineatus]